MKIINAKQKQGFTLIETMVAIFVLLISVTAPLSSAQSGLRSSFLARDQVVAFYLAQDAIETIKHVRDNYALSPGGRAGGDWLTQLGSCIPSQPGTARSCIVDTSRASATVNPSFSQCTGACTGRLYYHPTSRKYGHNSSSPNTLSRYSRVVYITEIQNNREAQVIVSVSWDSNFFGTKRVVVQENIYNWVPDFIK